MTPGDRVTRGRGQTTIDFAIGVSLFLIAVAFTLAFVPTMLQPFTDTTQEQTVTVNRVATQLSESLLVQGGERFVLDQRCTTAFFNATPALSSGGCGFSHTDPLATIVGVDSSTSLNVSVAHVDADGTRTLICTSKQGDIGLESTTDCSTTFARGGDAPPGSNSVIVSRRWVTLDGNGWTMLVKLW